MCLWCEVRSAVNLGTLPALVERSELPVAASLIGSSGQAAVLCAPTIGGALLTVMRPSYVLGFDAAPYLMSALLLLSIRRPFARPQPQQDRLRIRADIAEGLRFLRQQPVIRTLTFSVFCVSELGRHAFPMTPSGKIQKYQPRDSFAQSHGVLHPVSTAPTANHWDSPDQALVTDTWRRSWPREDSWKPCPVSQFLIHAPSGCVPGTTL